MRGDGSVLVVEDSPSFVTTVQAYLANTPYRLSFADTGRKALALAEEGEPQVILLDLNLPDMDGMQLLEQLEGKGLKSTVIVITANSSLQTAVEAMRRGAYDYILKPFSADRLRTTIQNAMERHTLSTLVQSVKATARRGYHGFIGSSFAMQAVYRTIDAAASSKASVFVTGESGTGKELCAVAIHRQSPRVQGPFIALNCAAIPRELMESEIFGHVKGAFTGATADREGAAKLADGGTLFLDEICEMDMDLQSKLLRFLQTGVVQKVGGSRAEKVDVRFVSATNRDPLAEVEGGRFREDLYYRLHVIPIDLPPLRGRGADVMEIAEHLLSQIAEEEGKAFRGFDEAVRTRFLGYDWPGNVRQLENVLRNIVVLHDGAIVTAEMLPAPLNRADAPRAAGFGGSFGRDGAAGSSGAAPALTPDAVKPLWQVEKDAIEAAIAAFGGNISKAATALGTVPSTIYRKQKSWADQVDGKE